jgi:nucleoside-diphosphate-sugar epimerase
MMNILVVGGAGYVGGGIVDKLQEKHKVTVYDSLIYENEFRKNVNFIYGDIRDYSKLNKILKNYDAVVWLAALVGDGACSINPTLTYEINSESVKNLVSNFNGKIIFFSTCSVYGAQEGVLSEESEVNPLSEYAKSKLVAEDILTNSDAIIFRLGTLFGIGDEFSRIRLDLVVNVLVTKALIDKKMSVFGGEQWRPLLHVKDVANAVDHTIESSLKGVYNLHYKNFRISEIADLIKDKIGNVEIITTPLPFQDARNYQVSSEKFKLASNFEAEVSLEKGIIEVFDLISSGRIKDINNPRYSNHDFLKTFGVN